MRRLRVVYWQHEIKNTNMHNTHNLHILYTPWPEVYTCRGTETQLWRKVLIFYFFSFFALSSIRRSQLHITVNVNFLDHTYPWSVLLHPDHLHVSPIPDGILKYVLLSSYYSYNSVRFIRRPFLTKLERLLYLKHVFSVRLYNKKNVHKKRKRKSYSYFINI